MIEQASKSQIDGARRGQLPFKGIFEGLKALTNPGANPTIASHNASAVKIYNATRSLVKAFFTMKNAVAYIQQHWRCSC
jgi:hypothetical protein